MKKAGKEGRGSVNKEGEEYDWEGIWNNLGVVKFPANKTTLKISLEHELFLELAA